MEMQEGLPEHRKVMGFFFFSPSNLKFIFVILVINYEKVLFR